MANDIDDLLNEVEKQMNKNNARITPRRSLTRNDAGSIDDAIDEILSDNASVHKQSIPSPSLQRLSNSASKKCFPIFISGTSLADVNRGCKNLRCTDCDFVVQQWENQQWTAETDYLFLRNNAPDRIKLQRNLRLSSGTKAYCCQCKHLTVANLTDIKKGHPNIHWVCGKH